MLMIKDNKGLNVYGKIKDNNILPLIVKGDTERVYMVKIEVKNNIIKRIIVKREIKIGKEKLLFNSILNMQNIILK